MQRRQVVSMVSSGVIVGLAGCSGSSGVSKKVVSNAYSDTLETSLGSLENTEVLGTDAVVLPVTIENTGDSEVTFAIKTEFFDGDTVVGTDEASSLPKEIAPGESKEFQQGIQGRKEDVTRVEVTIQEQDYF